MVSLTLAVNYALAEPEGLDPLGYHAVNLGPETPVEAFEHAIAHHAPRLLWITLAATALVLAFALLASEAIGMIERRIEYYAGARS